MTITIGATRLLVEDVAAIADGAPVELDAGALDRCAELVAAVSTLLRENRPIYGLTTGVGDLYTAGLGGKSMADAQLEMLRAHAAGVGAPHDERTVRAIMAAMIAALIQARSAVPPELVERLALLLNRGVTPVAPAQGSVGYLTATAHIGLVVFGEGEAWFEGERMSGADALRAAGITVAPPTMREGHALISGTYEITALACLALAQSRRLLGHADVTAAMSLEGARGNTRGFDPRVQELRPHPGQIETAARLRALLAGSGILAENVDRRLQDALSLRCVPQVHGSVRDALAFIETTVVIELNSVTDNPAFVLQEAEGGGPEVAVLPNGNGHGAPLAVALDYLAIALTEVANMSLARIERLTNGHLTGLAPFLSTVGASDSGLMVVPVTAAAVVGEIRQLAGPASIHSLSTVAGQEDHISQGVNAARKAVEILDRLLSVLAIELLCAAQAVDLLAPARPGRGTGALHAALRERIPAYDSRTEIHSSIAAARDLLASAHGFSAIEDALAGGAE